MNAMEREPARNPQDLERLLIDRQHAGDVDGMLALFEPDAVIDCSDGRLLRGHREIRAFYAEIAATGHKFGRGQQRPALISGDLALTSTKLPDGDIAKEYLASPERQMTTVNSGETLIGDAATGILVASDGYEGVIVSSVQNFIADFSGGRNDADIPPCPGGIAELRLSADAAATMPPLMPFLSQNRGTSLTVTKNGDKGVYVCGYIK